MLKCEDLGSSDALVVGFLYGHPVGHPESFVNGWTADHSGCVPQRFVNRVSALHHDPPGVVVFRLRDFLSLADGRFTESVP